MSSGAWGIYRCRHGVARCHQVSGDELRNIDIAKLTCRGLGWMPEPLLLCVREACYLLFTYVFRSWTQYSL